jgi:hypothetical protein
MRIKHRFALFSLVLLLAFTIPVTAFAGSVNYYSYTLVGFGQTSYGSLFTNNNSSPSIKGWQEGSYDGSTLVIHTLVDQGIFSDTVYSNGLGLQGEYPQNDSSNWYYGVFDAGVPIDTEMQVRARHQSSSCTTSVAGNVYN